MTTEEQLIESLTGEFKQHFASWTDKALQKLGRDRYAVMCGDLKAILAKAMARDYVDAAVSQVQSNYLAENRFMHTLTAMANDCVDREAYIVAECARRRVLHFGFADAPLKANLHAKVKAVAAFAYGVDIDGTAVEQYQRDTADANCRQGDVEGCGVIAVEPASPFDIVLVPEVLEHVRCPGKALATVAENCKAHGCEAIISVPNAFFFGNLFAAIGGKEVVHPDHRCWFSPQTLMRCIADSGMAVKRMMFYSPADMLATPGLTKSGIIARVAVV